MQTADFNPNDFAHSGQREADKSLLVKFFIKAKEDKAASIKEGRPIFKDREHIDIKIPGNRNSGACRPATPADIQRFPEHYAAFKQRTDNDVDVGTPLIEWPVISRSFAEELAFFHVKTVEQLATMADIQVGKFMGGFDFRAKARLWLERVNKEKPLMEMDARMAKMEEENASLKESLSVLVKEMENPERKAGEVKRALKKAAKQAE